MGYRIVHKKQLNNLVYLMDIEAPRVAKSAKPGQFVIVKIDERGERVPLTIADYDREKGTVSIVFQVVGMSSKKLSTLNEGDSLRDFVGPLGNPSEFIHEDIEKLKNKKFIFIAGGVGAAPVYPQVKWFKEHNLDVDVIIGAKTKDLLIFTEKMEQVAKNVYYATDDGSFGFHGMVTALLEDLVNNQGKAYDEAVVIGPMIMMKFASMTTKKAKNYASSASEMVTEVIQYIADKPKLRTLEAEALLAGIMLDTKNFSFKTGVRTFEAAAFLRKCGADTVEVKSFFQGDVDSYMRIAEIVKNAKIIDGRIAISYCDERLSDSKLIAAKVADELLNIKGVISSFVITKNESDVIQISARSLGKMNVQIIMEKLGGGGHMDTAATQLQDVTLEEAMDRLEDSVMEYLNEEENTK